MSRGCHILDRTPDRFKKSIIHNKYLDMQCRKRFITALDLLIDIFRSDSVNVKYCYAIVYEDIYDNGRQKLCCLDSTDTFKNANELVDYKLSNYGLPKSYYYIGLVIKFSNDHCQRALFDLPSININLGHIYDSVKLINKRNFNQSIKILKRLTRDKRINDIKI